MMEKRIVVSLMRNSRSRESGSFEEIGGVTFM